MDTVSDVVTEYLNLAAAVTVQFDHYLHLLSQLTATGTDETKTVAVTLNPSGVINNVWMEPGIKSLGAGIVSQRINVALQKATTIFENAKADVDADHSRELAALQARNDYLDTLIGVLPLTSPAPGLCPRDTRLVTETPAVTVSDPAGTICVTTRAARAINITVTPAALNRLAAELAAEVVEVARFSHARDRATRAGRLVAEAGDNEIECRRYLHRIPTHDDVDVAYANHYYRCLV